LDLHQGAVSRMSPLPSASRVDREQGHAASRIVLSSIDPARCVPALLHLGERSSRKGEIVSRVTQQQAAPSLLVPIR
jgi:hypothetical protein